jgi:hypothetical protein
LRKRLKQQKSKEQNIKTLNRQAKMRLVKLLTQQAISTQSHFIQFLFSNALTQQPNCSVKDDDDDDGHRTSLISQSSFCLCVASGVENKITPVKLSVFMFLAVDVYRKKGAR